MFGLGLFRSGRFYKVESGPGLNEGDKENIFFSLKKKKKKMIIKIIGFQGNEKISDIQKAESSLAGAWVEGAHPLVAQPKGNQV